MREMPCGFDYRPRTSLGDARDQRRKMLQLAVIATAALAAGTNSRLPEVDLAAPNAVDEVAHRFNAWTLVRVGNALP